jgi:hypothetical protein
MFPLPTLAYVKIGAGILLVLGAFAYGWHIRDVDFTEFKVSVRVAAEKQIAENQAKQKESELVNKGVQDAYEARIASIHAMYSGMQHTSSSAVSSVPNASITINGQTHNILDVAEQCTITTQQLISLQDWIRSQMSVYQ